ncbi:MAG: transcription-repair coupling factor [Ruminococcaceae bacterium]|nr:transcription-repair coupling factor [Oscillospiraceae bacterium]
MEALKKINKLYPELCAIENAINTKSTPVSISGTTGSQKNQLIYSTSQNTHKKAFIITSDEAYATKIKNDLESMSGKEVYLFDAKEYVFYDVDVSTKEIESKRINTLKSIENADFVVASALACMQYTLCEKEFKKYTKHIKISDIINPEALLSELINMGYKRVSTVEGECQFSKRGSILDIYLPGDTFGTRIEFFDDEIDTIRKFDIATQISHGQIDSFYLYPARELIFDEETKLDVIKKIKSQKNENLISDITKLEENGYFSSLDKYIPYFYKEIPTVFDYLSDDFLIFIDEPAQVLDKAKIYQQEQAEIITSMLEKGLFPKIKGDYSLTPEGLFEKALKNQVVFTNAVSHPSLGFNLKEIVNISAKTLPSYSGKSDFLIDDITYWKKNGYRIMLILSNEDKIKAVKNLLFENEIDAAISENLENLPEKGEVLLSVGFIEKSFEYPAIKTVVLSDNGVFAVQKRKVKKVKADKKNIIKSFDELKQGDYVVHNTHGIGQYMGIKELVVENVVRDYIKIKYRSGDFLYVPTNQLDLLHKYVGSEAKNVKLNKLGGIEWQKTTAKVKESVMELADDLIKLYAQRSEIKGYKFSPDTVWQKEFEDEFPYEETSDQLRCIEEVKKDMEDGKCMDRLLCGDVGYGKTEVALRAAFKCVSESFQVAYLVPTTLLAQQHYNTFKSRMDKYPIKVEMLSRFRTKKQQEEIIKKLKSGEIDVIIGTHRLLQKDIGFKNLGMLIIDEEQRFGVGHKESIKKLKNNVNVLTLSATPIPRTLNMALVGIRDLSVISEPPQNRYPVQTFVLERNEAVIENAISREMARGGQVYYLFNRVDGIEQKANEIAKMFPDKKVMTAHGKMSENTLEEIMLDFLNGDIDILICTTIIETGLDVANVNTIIIENADRLGLSQLYQLRGRVGRSNRLAYAYLTYEKMKVLDSVAQKRLQAIKEFTEFGSGFKIAMRDLEIRGAGNLLGKQQHGNMNLVGYDMYCMLLESAVAELKGEKTQLAFETNIDLKISAYIPKEYITDENIRIDMYKKIAQICDEEDVLNITDELIDRFGTFDENVANLIDIAFIKSLCQKLEITDITEKDGQVFFTINQNVNPKVIVEILSDKTHKLMFSSGEKSYLGYKIQDNMLSNIKIILQKMLKLTLEADNEL